MVINEEQEQCLDTDGLRAVRPTHLLLYDRELTPAVVKAGGWLCDGEGDAHRVTKLGHRECVDQEKNTHHCDACGHVLWTLQALHSHTASQWCIPVMLMNTRQQRTRRQARKKVARRKGEIRGVIPVKLEDADGIAVEPVAEFVYLSSNITRDVDATKEVRDKECRRLLVYLTAFQHIKCSDCVKHFVCKVPTNRVSCSSSNSICGSSNSVGGSSNSVGGSNNSVGGSSNSVGGSSNSVGGSSNSVGGSSNSVGGSSNSVGGSSNSVGGSSNSVGGSSNSVGGSSNNVGRSNNSVGGSSNSVGGSSNSVGGSSNSVGGSNNSVGGSSNSVGGSSNSVGGNSNSVGAVAIVLVAVVIE